MNWFGSLALPSKGQDRSNDVPHVFDSVAELAAGNTCAQTEVADTDGVILKGVGEVVLTFGHGANKHTHTLFWSQVCNVVTDAYDLGVKAQSHFAAVWRQMVGDWIFDDLE